MRKVKFSIVLKETGSTYEEIMEYDSDTKDKDIEREFEEWKQEQITGEWLPIYSQIKCS